MVGIIALLCSHCERTLLNRSQMPDASAKVAGAQRPRCILTHALVSNRVPPHASDGTDAGHAQLSRNCVLRPFSHTAVSIDKNQATETRSTPMETINTPATPDTTSEQGTRTTPQRKGGFAQGAAVAQGCCGETSTGS